MANSSKSTPRRETFRSVMQQAKKHELESGGYTIEIPAIITGSDLKRAIEMQNLGANYFVQMRRDVYKITLPGLKKEQLDVLFA